MIRNGYRKDRYCHRFGSHHRSMFLPMLCSRPSVKSVALPRSGDSEALSDEAEPMSPKVGCMGQVKKRNNRVVGLPTPYKLNGNMGVVKAGDCNRNVLMSCGNAKYSKLRKLFSSKGLLLMGTATACSPSSANVAGAAAAARRRRSVSKSGSFESETGNLKEAVVDIGKMDPPLPVVKKVRKPEEEEEGGSLWRRRFGGLAPDLRTLEIKHNTNPRHHLQLVTV